MASPTSGRRNVRKGSNSQNIKVFVRCRPLNSIEKNSKSFSCVDVQNSREVVVKERPLDKFTKTFSFDRVFGPEAKQIDVYKSVAKNSVEEVLSGFNCTIFAYGQTGTGKTFTMEGDRTPDNTSWDDEPMAGIIPRCVNHLFDELRIQKLEFTMRVSFLELYNEELFDLLSPNDDLSKLRLYEDATRKGSCIIQGLEEVLVRTKANVYEVLEKGSNKRQTAATLMNAHSSRSHTVFTVTLHIKENTVDGDELLRTGKLHLVDLAGSENIGRSGAVDKRAREAGSINMSLLTLGRVITALVEKTPHVPYRESKLTRLLQDALGGRTKTSIIATISPASVNLEETLSTLDYAHRAKNIQNKPEVNQKLNKKELIGEYSQEIERLRLDLMAMREKNGVYLANENYQEMIQTMENQAQEIMEKINYIRSLEEGIEQKTNDLNTANTKLDDLAQQLKEMKEMLRDTKEVLSCTQKLLHQTSVDRDEQKYLVSAHVKTEAKLLFQGKALVELAGTTTGDLAKLHDKIDRKKNVEDTNLKIGEEFQGSYEQNVEKMRKEINNVVVQQAEAIENISLQFGGSVSQCKEEISSIVSQWKTVSESHKTFFNELHMIYKERTEKELTSTWDFCEDRLGDTKNQKNRLKKFEETLFLPAMEKLASLISTEDTLMTSMQACVTDKLNDLDKKCEAFVKHQNSVVTDYEGQMLKLLDSFSTTVSSCRTTFDTLCGSVDQKCKALESKTREMETLLSSVKEIGQTLEVDVNKAKDILPTSLSHLETTTGSAKNQLKNFSDDLANGNSSHLSYIRTLVSDTKASVEEQSTKMEQNVQHLGEERCGLESIISQHVNDANIYCNKQDAEIVRYKESAQKSSEKSIQEHSAQVERAVTGIETDREKLISSLEGESMRLEKDLSLLKDQYNITIADLLKQIENHSSQLEIQKVEVLELFSEKMVQDIPTGETPVRKEYKYSRLLPATSPHDRLLERYRQGSATTLSKIPLPTYGEDTEEEVASPSFESSLSSESSQVEEEIFETRSLSSSVSDIHSNSGSVSDLRSKNDKDTFAVPNRPALHSRENSGLPLSRSSSTSSIPEMKDKENSSSVQKGSTKKRGLRPPFEKSSIPEPSNSRSRRVLGMQN